MTDLLNSQLGTPGKMEYPLDYIAKYANIGILEILLLVKFSFFFCECGYIH